MSYFFRPQPYDPMSAMMGGMALWKGAEQSYDSQLARMRAQREREALAKIGEGDLLAGFEEVPTAIRPDWVKHAYASGNPDLALKAEAMAAEPHRFERDLSRSYKLLDRDVEKQKQLFQAQMDSKMNAWRQFMPGAPGAAPGPRGPSASVGMETDQGMLPPGGGVLQNPSDMGALGRAMDGTGLAGLSGGKYKTTFDFNKGPGVEYQPMSPLEEEVMRRESILKGHDAETKQRQLTEQIEQNARGTLENAHKRVYDLAQAKKQLQKDFAAGDISPADYRAELSGLDNELTLAKQYRDGLLKGSSDPRARALVPETPAQADPPAKVSRKGAGPAQPKASATLGAGLPYKMQQEIQAKMTQKKAEIAQGAIEESHADADKYTAHHGTLKNLMDLVATKDVGKRVGQLPGGETALRLFSEDHDKLQKWRNELIDVMKKEGQSQLMNTLPELAIVADQFPSVGNSPDTNRKAMANVMNIFEARMAAPKFLEDWAATHGGSIDGARGVMREWMTNNKRYQTEQQGGKTTLYDTDIIPLEAWSKLRQKYSAEDIKARWEKMNAR